MSEKPIRVVVDAGHGGADPGATNGSKHEAVATLAIAKKVGEKLKAKGFAIKYTRSADKYVSLEERCRIGNDFGANAFISIHLNSASNREADGIETWRFEKVGAKTKDLANNVQTELIAATGAKSRGVKSTTMLYVLRHTVAPAVLVECGFISNGAEAKLLFSDKYQEKLATAIVSGIVKAMR